MLSDVYGDKLRYMQILMNLLTNAIKFTEKGKAITIRVLILDIDKYKKSPEEQHSVDSQLDHCDQNESYEIKIGLEVQDEGVGIEPENISKLFVDFAKLNEHSQINHSGTGLGLSICKQLAKRMNGDIEVKSEKNVGTTFLVTILSKVKIQKLPDFAK